ncbi:VOC family protein [Nocardioides sp.]|uniref:VOC family protein n=1 Tax=Nocardioides sp. TaxID=35761 RepID=UPI0037836B4B
MIASWKDLCIDAVDTGLLGRFWADTLGREVTERGDGLLELTGPTPHHRVWINPVPEPVTVKQRVHLDMHAASTGEVVARGATPLDLTSFRWDVLRDPEGGELCVFPREQVPDERLYEIVVDSVDPAAQARWWAEAIGGRWEHDEEHGWAWVEEIPGAPFECLVFVPVPEPKTVKNRIHWDVDTADVGLLVEHGATVLREPDDDISWTVLADPEGNELCAFVQ